MRAKAKDVEKSGFFKAFFIIPKNSQNNELFSIVLDTLCLYFLVKSTASDTI